MRIGIPILVSLAFVAGGWAGENWPQFRGPNGDGLSDSTGLVTKWSETENIRWKTPIHDKGWSSPVVWGKQIWMTTAPADGKAYYAVCVDRKTGAVIHDLKLFTEENPAFCHPFNSYASPTPVIEEGRIYVHFGVHGTACLDTATGQKVWDRRDLECDHWRGPGSSPIIWGKLLFLTFDGYDQQYVVALDKETGKTVWKKDRNIVYSVDNGDLKKAYSTPSILMVDGKPQLVSPSAEATIAYNPETGDELWRARHGGMNEACRPLFGHGLIYLTSGHTSNLLALKQGGSGDVTSNIVWKTNRGAPTRPSPLLVGDAIYMMNDNGIASCVDALTGKQIWSERIGKPCSASPVCANGLIYAPDQEGRTIVFAASRTYSLIATNRLDDGCMASPAIAGDAIFLRTKTNLYCIGKK
jgi:outer membrane protein assembly factor BamB